jgi:hypothetical protein
MKVGDEDSRVLHNVGIYLPNYILLTSQVIVIIRVELQVGTYEHE